MKIELNRHEMLVCELFGSIRRKNAMQFNFDNQVSKQNPYDMDIDGFMGEFVVAKHLNVMVDTSINEKKNPIDLYWNNKSIDVKTSRNNDAKLYVTEYHRIKPCDIYIMVFIEENIAIIKGWIDSKTLFEKAKLIVGKHKAYMLEQNCLKNIETI
jgi:hypothetical protein